LELNITQIINEKYGHYFDFILKMVGQASIASG